MPALPASAPSVNASGPVASTRPRAMPTSSGSDVLAGVGKLFRLPHEPQMRLTLKAGILESVAHRTVHSDMRRPDQPKLDQQRHARKPADRRKNGGVCVGVGPVVDPCAPLLAG